MIHLIKIEYKELINMSQWIQGARDADLDIMRIIGSYCGRSSLFIKNIARLDTEELQ